MDASERSLLTAMPLHAITALHGEAGLRERLAAETASMPAAGREQVGQALGLAARLHAADRRQREPYVNHVLRVAIRILAYYEVADPDVICAALLHDAVEDHADDLACGQGAGGALAVIASRFGERVAGLVGALTVPPSPAGAGGHRHYARHVAAALEGSPWARVIKASDFADNGAGLIHATGPRPRRLAAKYAPLVPVLRDMITRPDTPLAEHVKDRILAQLARAAARFTALGAGPARRDRDPRADADDPARAPATGPGRP